MQAWCWMQGDLYRSYNASAAQALTSPSAGIYALSATPVAPSPTQSLHLGAVSSVRGPSLRSRAPS